MPPKSVLRCDCWKSKRHKSRGAALVAIPISDRNYWVTARKIRVASPFRVNSFSNYSSFTIVFSSCQNCQLVVIASSVLVDSMES